jgi:hypothetical protein
MNPCKAKSNFNILPSHGSVTFELFAAVELFMAMEPFIDEFNAAEFVAFPLVVLLPLRKILTIILN